MIDKANRFKQYVTSNLTIPPGTPPTVQGANALLQVEYQVSVSAVTTTDVNRSITFPIIIGASSSTRMQQEEDESAMTTAMRRENDIAINCTPMSFSMLTVFPPVPWEPSTFVDDDNNTTTTSAPVSPLSPTDTEITVVNNVSTQANETIRSPLLTPSGGATAALFGSIFRMDRGGSYELDPSDDDVTEYISDDEEEDADDIDLLSIMHRSQQHQRPTYVDDRGTYLVAL